MAGPTSKIKILNEKLAVKTSLSLGTMACVYVFLGWSLIPLLRPSLEQIVFYVSGGVLQLVLLPMIMVGQRVLGRAQEERAQEDHEAIMEELKDLREIMAKLDELSSRR